MPITETQRQPSQDDTRAAITARLTAPLLSRRLAWLDLFRGLAVFGMIDTHVSNALLRTPAEITGIYYLHDKLFNLPAPAFLFASGISFGMAVPGRWKQLRSWSPELRRRLLRLAEILLLGFALHVPYFSFRRAFFETAPAQFHTFLNMDVLQCIGISLLLLLVLLWLSPRPGAFLRASTILMCLVALVTPWVWWISAEWPWWAATYLSKRWDSFFPLLPYAGFVFAGAAWGYLFAVADRSESAAPFFKLSARVGGVLMLAGIAAAFLPLPVPYNNFWVASPQFFFVRIGFFSVVIPFLAAVTSLGDPATRSLVAMGRESLLIYIAHLMIIYGSLVNSKLNLRNLVGKQIGFWEWLAAYALLTIAMVGLATLWSSLKKKLDWRVNWIEWTVAAAGAAVFVIR